MALAPIFPLVPWFWPLLLLQIVNGAALNFAWSGSQTLIARLAEGEAEYIGRFSFFARFGSTLAPVIAGTAWDWGGAWPAYMLGVAWGAVLTIALLRAPEAVISEVDGRVSHRRVGQTGISIGILFAAIEVMSGLGSLFAGRAMRLGDPQRTMLSGTALSIVLICLTPFLGGIFLLLFLAQTARGWLQGVVQPLMFSVQAKAVGRYRQGLVVGLRQTMNRLAAIVIPPVMGAIADRWGAGESFVILGALLLLLSVPVALITRRAGRLQQGEPRLAD